MKKILLHTDSAEKTKRIGRIIGKHLLPGAVVTLQGELGAGKTTLVKGIAKGLGLASEKIVSSPTFVLIHEYTARKKIYHIDWYRLRSVEGADEALAEECFASDSITLVEWPERGKSLIPLNAVAIRISHRGFCSRSLEIFFPTRPAPQFLKALKKP